MKWAVRITIAVILGAVINVGVAWEAALWSREVMTGGWRGKNQVPPDSPTEIPAEWFVPTKADGSSAIQVSWYEDSGWGVTTSQTFVAEDRGFFELVTEHTLHYRASGWPLRSLSCSVFAGPDGMTEAVVGGFEAPAWLHPVQYTKLWSTPGAVTYLPYKPRFIGLVFNTVFFSAFFLMIMVVPPALHRMIRARAGKCLSCGYNRKGLASPSTPCPECGAAPTPAPAAEVRG